METLTREHEAAVAATEEVPAAAPPPAAQARPCATCGASLAPDQDWCLECGTARPDSFAPAPGWRGAAAVLVATGVLAAGAVAAAWAGLSADAKRVAASTTQAALPPAAPPAPTAPAAPAAPPAQTTPPPAAPAPKAPPTPKATTKPPKSVPAPKAPAAKTPAPAAAAPAAPAKAKPKPKPAAKPKRPTPKLAAVTLAGDATRTYNPYARPENDFTDAHLAIDGDPQTSWTATFSGDQSGAVGVDVSLGKLVGVRALQLHTATPGMTVEIYATRGETEPVSIQDPGWDHLATQLDVGSSERIRLGDGSARYRHVLVWPTEAPPEGDHVALTELELFR